MPNINTRIIEWAKNSVLLAELPIKSKIDNFLADAFCENQEKRTTASYDLWLLFWGNYPELGPCPDFSLLSKKEYERAFYSKYRDHLSHSVKTLFLGVYLFEENSVIRKGISLRLNELGATDTNSSFLLTWIATALSHDIGYLFETDKIYDSAYSSDFMESINSRLCYPLSSTSFFNVSKAIETQIISELEIYTPRINAIDALEDENTFQILHCFSERSQLSLSNNGVKAYYDYAKSTPLGVNRTVYKDHGIASALILLKTWLAYAKYIDRLKEAAKTNSIKYCDLLEKLEITNERVKHVKDLIIEAAGATALHNIQKDCWDKSGTLAKDIQLDNFKIHFLGDSNLPFAYLLKLTDELQCWDRPKFEAPTDGVISLTGDDVDIVPTDLSIGVWFKSDDKLSEPDLDTKSEYAKLCSYLSTVLFINETPINFYRSVVERVAIGGESQGADVAQSNIEQPIDHTDVVGYLNDIEENYRDVAAIYAGMSAEELSGALENAIKPEALGFVSRTFLVNPLNQLFGHSFEKSKNPVQVEGLDQFFEYFIEHKRVALTGDPGCGKSTTLGAIAHRLATLCLRDTSSSIPVFIPLGGMAGDKTEDYLLSHIDVRVRTLLRTGRLLLLLDGFNEISANDACNLTEWVKSNSAQSLIVSCRRADYTERQLPLRRIDIEPLDVKQIWLMIGNYLVKDKQNELFWTLAGDEAKDAWDYYVERYIGQDAFTQFWYGNIGPVRPTDKEKTFIRDLQNDIKNNKQMPGMLPLVSNPYLLFSAIELASKNQAVPQSRTALLAGFANLTLDKVKKSSLILKGITGGSVKFTSILTEYSQDPTYYIAFCAFRMSENGCGTAVQLSWLLEDFTNKFQGVDEIDFIDKLIEASILEKTGYNGQQVKFRHQLLQEFFSAVHLCITHDYSKFKTIFAKQTWWEKSHWDETIRIAAELLKNATELIKSLYKIKPDLAFSCIQGDVYCKQDIKNELLNPTDLTIPVSPHARALWGESLVCDGHFDNRNGVGVLDGNPDFDWISVRRGQVNVGIESGESTVIGVTGNTISVDVGYDFFISKYPVTRAQFDVFLQGGYEDKDNWSELGWRWKGTRSYPELWESANFSLKNAPVVGVSWFEAQAFCRWATRKLTKRGWVIDLPLEAEWEHAARFPDGRIYPWGNEYEPGNANIDESSESKPCGPFSLNKYSSVGIYKNGFSALGISDLCGNVWEWCKNRWDVRYEWPEVTTSDKLDHRVIKGGSWYNSILFASLGVHDCLDADLGVNDVGFRVVMKITPEAAQDVQESSISVSSTVRKILVLGTSNSGRTEFVRSVGDFPLQEVQKKDLTSGEQIKMDYGRCFYKERMHYLYAPVEADDNNLDRFIGEMDDVIFVHCGCEEYLKTESIIRMSNVCKNQGIPLIVGCSSEDLSGFTLNRDWVVILQQSGIEIKAFSAIERKSCLDLLDNLFREEKQVNE
ncbi:hypothetical protein FACS1894190_12470 [Spirochaetia bacterium]|nr:hypothetical protein FACS1894190_12470 [Spirochaetia bacterium]